MAGPMLCGAVPIVPDKLSYTEIYGKLCYPASWAQNIEKAKPHTHQLVKFIQQAIGQYSPTDMHKAALKIGKRYFSGGALYAELFRK